jgi:dolichol-phosphate mannosyltransferase
MTGHGNAAAAPAISIVMPVFNGASTIGRSIESVLAQTRTDFELLVIDDGSTDDTPLLLARQPVEVIRHAENRGYGRSMQDMLRWARVDGYAWLITMDCDEQHEPQAIPQFIEAIERGASDVISGSRYLRPRPEIDDSPPEDRRTINAVITRELNERLGLRLTDAFCGFKAYRVAACNHLDLDVDGYDFPMQFWVQAVAHRLRIEELPVRLIYPDPSRSFGGPLDDPRTRLEHYRRTLHREIRRCARQLPARALDGLHEPSVQ